MDKFVLKRKRVDEILDDKIVVRPMEMNKDAEFLPYLPVAKIPVTELNTLLTCELCSGYFFNAATITECLHTFCKSCLVRHIAISLLCPKCKVLIHPTDPLVNIRLDSTMQDVLYKLLPQVEQEEQKRERQFYEEEEKLTPSYAGQKLLMANEGGIESRRIVRRKKVSAVSSFGTAIVLEFAGGSLGIGCTDAIRTMLRRYLWVPRYTTVGRIQNYLHKKLNLDSGVQVCIFALTYYLNESLTLDSVCDAFFPHSATKPIVLHYAVLPKKNLFS